jgi:PAS domain S-box-containing protein
MPGKRESNRRVDSAGRMDTIAQDERGKQRRPAFQALRESEALHRATLSNISDAVFLTDDDGVFTFVCPNVDIIFGYVPDEVHAMTRISRLLGENLFDPAELAARGEIKNIEREVTSKSGERRVVLIHLKKVAIQGSTVLYTCRDVTERRHAEEELRAARLNLAHASRLALVGELMASLAHELNQPLTSILNNASAGLRSPARSSPWCAARRGGAASRSGPSWCRRCRRSAPTEYRCSR